MERISVADFRPGDVVLAECWFVRRELLGGWQTSFHVKSLSKLTAPLRSVEPGVEATPFPWKV